MITLNKQQKNYFLWAGVLLILFMGILTFHQGSSVITAIIAVVGLLFILVWKIS